MKKKIALHTAASLVIANMIGTGVFTSLGFQLAVVQNSWSVLLLWVIGGLLALFGAFAYAELGTHFRESGGDYIYLSRVFHPLLGYLSAWAGLTVGFSAPVALAAMAFSKYLSPFGLEHYQTVAVAVILLVGLMHSFTIHHSSRMQNLSTVVKLAFIVTLIFLGFIVSYHGPNALHADSSWRREIITPGFAISMIYAGYAYTGWNAAAYIVDEIDNPRKNLPRALIGSAFVVSIIYVLFQFVLLKTASVSEMSGREDVTFIAFNNLLGKAAGRWVSAFIAIQLVATISSYLWVGPRVTWAMARENRLWKPVSVRNSQGIPVRALWLHVMISILLVLTGSFERVLLYAGFVLQLMASLTVATSLFTKKTGPDIYTSPFKPWLQIIFLLFNSWVLIFTMADRPKESLMGLGILGIGVIIYFFDAPVVDCSRKDAKAH